MSFWMETNWEPWTTQPWDENEACNYFIRLYVDPYCWESSLEKLLGEH